MILLTTPIAVMGCLPVAQAATPSFTNLCSGVGVSLPALTAVPQSTGGALGSLAAQVLPVVNGVVNDLNTNVFQPLGGKQLTVGLFDPGTNTFVAAPAGACNLALNGLAVDNNNGIAVGGGQILGLGGTGGVPVPIALCDGTGCEAAWSLSGPELDLLRHGLPLRLALQGWTSGRLFGGDSVPPPLVAIIPGSGFPDALAASLR